ncbi:MAG TPA: ABC transporter ATP-binding protein [Bryobacteraceae bacterium]|nr:ABC transporter ATP-binding protein [Bryobacteraceae bacterium]
MDVSLALQTLTKTFPSHRVVDGISLDVPKSCFYSLLGPSGCGKTTILRMIAGFAEPDSGEIVLNGRKLNGLRPYERPVTTVFQNYALFPHLTAAENIAFGLQRRGESAAAIAPKVTRMLELVGLQEKGGRLPANLSGGEKQRTALARALVVEPELLLLDEPLSALDPALRKRVRIELKQLQQRLGITFLFITHDQEEALSLSDRIAVMNKGKIEQIGTPREIYLTPRTRFVASFLGAVNWVDGAGIRPESTRISRQAPGNGARAVEAEVDASTFLGDCFHVHTRTAKGETVTAQIPHDSEAFANGDRVHVWWDRSDELPVQE